MQESKTTLKIWGDSKSCQDFHTCQCLLVCCAVFITVTRKGPITCRVCFFTFDLSPCSSENSTILHSWHANLFLLSCSLGRQLNYTLALVCSTTCPALIHLLHSTRQREEWLINQGETRVLFVSPQNDECRVIHCEGANVKFYIQNFHRHVLFLMRCLTLAHWARCKQGGCVFCLCPFASWFVNRITQKVLNRFPWNLDGGWVPVQNRPHQLFPWNLIKFTNISYLPYASQHPLVNPETTILSHSMLKICCYKQKIWPRMKQIWWD